MKKRPALHRSLEGKTVLITAGPTVEDWDPVRFLSNRSSGLMGYALARQAAKMGARVILISGPVNHRLPENIERIEVRSAREMLDQVRIHRSKASYLWMVAAVADYRPSKTANHKIKRHQKSRITLNLVRNPDILKDCVRHRNPNQVIIGFAAETRSLRENALTKLKSKGCDFLFVNPVAGSKSVFDAPTGSGQLFHQAGGCWNYARQSKDLLAKALWRQVLDDIQP
jgi:phosphopantothenoylcysteine decarboxylase/phosphopantothenate--cysteine ligase